jgi:hypothetical protein
MEKRYQVFVSSTYADLKEERQRVTQTLMEMDCIPAGMELFPATDEEQWEFIKSIIDDCDYYLLIIGGRYGSTTSEGISYTEKEYDYAVECDLKVIALLHENPDEINVGKSDIKPELRKKLQVFRNKVETNRLVKFWNEAKNLPGLVALSLSKTIKMFPATGWVRASVASNEEILGELNELRKENRVLRTELANMQSSPSYNVEGLAGLDEAFTITGTYYVDYGNCLGWSSKITWRKIFSIISPYLVQNPNQEYVKSILHNALIKRDNLSNRTNSMSDQDFQTIAVQLKALGLINTKYAKTTKGNMAMFWSFTPEGERLMVQLRVIPSTKTT